MTNSKNIGNKGEELAAEYIVKKGYSLLARNWYYNHRELDIVARHNNDIVFIEVKTRAKDSLQLPSEAVTLKKQKLIIEAAHAYIIGHNINLEARFDIIEVIHTFDGVEIEHIENAFYPRVS